MGRTVYLHDINDFGKLETPEFPPFGPMLASAIIHDYINYTRRWTPGGLPEENYASYIMTLMEGLDGFGRLAAATQTSLIHDGVCYLMCFIDRIDTLTALGRNHVDLYPSSNGSRRVALIT